MHGPIDYIVVGFEGNKFDGSILKALADAIDNGTIALVALAAVIKGEDGTVSQLDITNLGDTYLTEFSQKYPTNNDMVNSDDIDEVGDLLETNTAAGFLVVEQLWAIPLKQAILNANGTLLAEGRIHPEAAAELNEEGAN
jgi:Family of unknown function (DUF6325)